MFNALKKFIKTSWGIASVEFALIAPMMILFMFGAIEGRTVHHTGDRVVQAASILADVIAKEAQISPEEIDDLMIGVENIVEPLNKNKLRLRVASIVPDDSGNAIIQWSRQNKDNKVPWDPGKKVNGRIDNRDILKEGHSLVYAEVIYTEDSGLTGKIVGKSLKYEHDKFRFPRRSRRVDLCDLNDASGEYENCI